MAHINTEHFAQKIEEYLQDRNKPDYWFYHSSETFGSVNAILSRNGKGLHFGYNTKLMMQLIGRAHDTLKNPVDQKTFAHEIAQSMQSFAQPFDNGHNLCYPHFLLHDLARPSLEQVIGQFNTNSRIIHETIPHVPIIISEYGEKPADPSLITLMGHGMTDDYFGVAYLLAKSEEKMVTSISGYIAKLGFFTDTTEKKLYILTIQSKRWNPRGIFNADEEALSLMKYREQEYNNISEQLGMGPRVYLLRSLADYAAQHGFHRIKVIRPHNHPMFIEKHVGFSGNYEKCILKAGIAHEHECYLEKDLQHKTENVSEPAHF